nr:hypothetical protein [Tanacetum cinerariifolium]
MLIRRLSPMLTELRTPEFLSNYMMTYVVVRHAYLVDINTELKPKEAPLKAEELQPLGSRVPLMGDEFEALNPLVTRTISSNSLASLDSIAPLSPDHPLIQDSPTPTPTQVSFHRRTARMAVRIQPTLSFGISAQIAEEATLSLSSFRKRYRSSYVTPSTSSSLTLPIRKRYRGTSEIILDTKTKDESSDSDAEGEGSEYEGLGLDDEGHGLEDEGHGLEEEGPGLEEEEDATPEGQWQVVLIMDTAMDELFGLGYEALRHRELALGEGSVPSKLKVGQSSRVYTDILTYVPPIAPVQTPPSPEWSSGSMPVLPSSLVVLSPIASPMTTPEASILVDDDQFLEVGAQLELYGSIIHNHMQRLNALLPTLFEGYVMDFRELYTRSGVRVNHDLRRKITEERHERLELTDCVARMERRQETRGEYFTIILSSSVTHNFANDYPSSQYIGRDDQFLEIRVQLELYRSIIHDHMQRLNALPYSLFEGYVMDLKELYTRSGVVRDEIFSKRYRFRSLEREQERAMVTFNAIWSPVLALEAWAGQTDAQRAALRHAIYDIQRANHDLRR